MSEIIEVPQGSVLDAIVGQERSEQEMLHAHFSGVLARISDMSGILHEEYKHDEKIDASVRIAEVEYEEDSLLTIDIKNWELGYSNDNKGHQVAKSIGKNIFFDYCGRLDRVRRVCTLHIPPTDPETTMSIEFVSGGPDSRNTSAKKTVTGINEIIFDKEAQELMVQIEEMLGAQNSDS